MVDLRAVAPTVARILGVPAPKGAEVEPIAEVVATLPRADRLALVLVDGFGSALWAHVRTAVPTLNRLAELHRVEISSVLPSLTYICISTMVTGASPGGHGVAELEDMVRVSAEGRVDTVFDRVREAGRETLLAVHRRDVEGVPLARFADRVVLVEEREDTGIFARTPELLRLHRPAFAFLHLIDVDEAAHAHGPYSAEVARTASDLDGKLKALLAGLAEMEYAVLVLADHGHHETPGGRPDSEGHLGVHDGSVPEDLRVPVLWASAEELATALG